MRTYKDVTGRQLIIGDIVVYTLSAGQAVSGLHFGEVKGFGKSSVLINPLNNDLTQKMKKRGHWEETGRMATAAYSGQPYPEKRWVVDGEEPAEPTRIQNPRPDRFYIVKKV